MKLRKITTSNIETHFGTARSSEVVQGEAANKWPELNTEKYTDAQMRNLMSSMIILEPSDPTVQLMFPDADSGFDFGEEIREKARALKA